MVPVAYAPLIIESFRRELRSHGIEPAEPRPAERHGRLGPSAIIARFARTLSLRRPAIAPETTLAGVNGAPTPA